MKPRFDKKLYMGIVEDNYDPNRKGRLKVRIQSLYNEIPLENIPYASPFMDVAGKEFKVPAIGKIVNILFLTNDFYDPYYIYAENYNINLENKLNGLTDKEYVDFVALLFDERTQIHADSEELTIDHFYNKMTINKSQINHELKDNSQLLNLGSRNADQDAVLGDRWFEWFDRFVDELLIPTSLLGNKLAPVQKVHLDTLLQEYNVIKGTFRSDHVKIVDNNQVPTLERSPKTDTAKEDKSLIDNTFTIEKNVEELQKSIEKENKKSCENEKSGKPSSQLSQPETEINENDPDFVPAGGSYEKRIINGQEYTVNDTNRWYLDNMEKVTAAEQELQFNPSGQYHGQDYYVEGEDAQQSKVYNPDQIENTTIPIPDSIGDYNVWLSGVEKEKKSAVKLQNKIIIKDYYPALKKMIDASKSDGITIKLNDAFRKYEDQLNLRVQNAPSSKKQNMNFLETARSSQFSPVTGRPGYSRHSLGVAFDISTAGGKNTAYKWLEKNAINFGFIRTVKSETWHWEYKPWDIEGVNITPWDKYAVVPKNHHTWNEENFDDEQPVMPNTSKKNEIPNSDNAC